MLLNALREMTVRTYHAHEVVFNCGDHGSEYFVVARGRVSIRVPT
jgi:CRP-like cAMP-binding protein